MLLGFASHDPSAGRVDGLDPVQPAEVSDRDEVREEIGSTLTAMMPWAVSIFVHMALIVLAFLLVWQTIVEQPEPEQVTRLAQTPRAVITPEPDENKQESSEAEAADTFDPIINPVSLDLPDPMVGQTRPKQQVVPPTEDPIPPRTRTNRRGDGAGDGLYGIGVGRVGDGDGEGEKGGQATRIAYVVDASGSMVDVLPLVVNELKRVVNKSHGNNHEITVLFFSGSGVHEIPVNGKRGLRPVTPFFKQRFNEWVTLDNHRFETGGRGSATVKQALTQALSYKPHVIYLLSDNLTGGGQGATQHEIFQDDLLDLVQDMNKSIPPARIHSVQFLYEDPLVRAGLTGTLERIADETGGVYKFLTHRDLNLR